MNSRKLIEVALPLDAINAACKADKDRKTGTLRNLHKWFAPMPLPAWRALLFAALVDDPGDDEGRDRLQNVIERLMQSGADLPAADAVKDAKSLIDESWAGEAPPIFDPFCGGGSTLVEGLRLGREVRGSDLNPVPVLISRLLAELLPQVHGRPALHPSREELFELPAGLRPLAADVRHYAGKVRQRVWDRLSLHYPEPQGESIYAWLWARTARCPNPACKIETLLATSWDLSRKKGEEAWLVPSVVEDEIRLTVAHPPGTVPLSAKTGRGANFSCLRCEALISDTYLAQEGQAGRIGLRMTAVAAIDPNGKRFFRIPSSADVEAALEIERDERGLEIPITRNPRWFAPPIFGFERQADLYTPRQLATLQAFADELQAIPQLVAEDGGDELWGQTIAAVLGLGLGKIAQASSCLAIWRTQPQAKAELAFGRHDMPMNWDFPEVHPFGGSVGDWTRSVETSLRALKYSSPGRGRVEQRSANAATGQKYLVATDPPYFDQIGYADLADYFYVWHRRALRSVFPDIYSTRATPKQDELVAIPSRHNNDRQAAYRHFVDGFTGTFHHLQETQHPDAPMLVVYAFKEQRSGANGDLVSPGWAAILTSLIDGGFVITATWPIHGTTTARWVSAGTNALATYVVMVCRPRSDDANRITRSDFTRLLRTALTDAVVELQHANIAPVDLAQAVIGPGMQVYSQHAAVVENDGTPVPVEDALALINRTLAETLDEQEGDLDGATRWALTWYEEHGFADGTFGKADGLARPKGVAVNDLVQAGIVDSAANRVRLISRPALPDDWDPKKDRQPTAWEAVQHLVKRLEVGGETSAAALHSRLGRFTDPARELAYRLFRIADSKGWQDEALAYNGLVSSWSEIARLADDLPPDTAPGTLF